MNKRGQIVELEGDTTIPVNKIRSQAFQDYFAKPGGCSVTVVSVGYSDEEAYEIAKECIANYPDMKGMFITTGTPLPVARAIEESGKDIKLVMFDHSQEIFRYIQKGIIAAAIGQDPFGQGHDPVVWMYNTIVTGQPLPSEFMKCRANVVDKENVDSLVGI